MIDEYGNPVDPDCLQVTLRGQGVNATSADDAFILPPSSFSLSAHPNPFNAVTTISFLLPTASDVELSVFDVAGRHVQTLHDGVLNAGEHRIVFDADNLPSGIYFARMEMSSQLSTQKLLLIK